MGTSVHANEHVLEPSGFVYAADSRDVAMSVNRGGVRLSQLWTAGSRDVCCWRVGRAVRGLSDTRQTHEHKLARKRARPPRPSFRLRRRLEGRGRHLDESARRPTWRELHERRQGEPRRCSHETGGWASLVGRAVRAVTACSASTAHLPRPRAPAQLRAVAASTAVLDGAHRSTSTYLVSAPVI